MKALATVFLAWFLAQLFKLLKEVVCQKQWKWSLFLENGGMPSAHASTVTALSLSVYAEQGWSLLFLVCIVFSLVVLNDSLNVRWQIGLQASLLKKLLKKKTTFKLSQSIGHRPSEVAAGILLGALLVLLFYI